MIEITTKREIREATVSLQYVVKNMPKAFVSAINRVSAGIRTEAVRKVRETYVIKAGDVRNTIKITKANTARLEMMMVSRGRNIPLIQFRTTPRQPPSRQPKVLKAQVKKEGGKKPIPGAFVAQMQSSHIGVFDRVGKRRLPIKELYGPAVPIMLGEPGVQEHIELEAQRRMAERLDHEVNRVLGRFKPV